jgi:hypothetical protein
MHGHICPSTDKRKTKKCSWDVEKANFLGGSWLFRVELMAGFELWKYGKLLAL